VSSSGSGDRESLLEINSKLQQVDFSKIDGNLDTLKSLSSLIIPLAAENEQHVVATDISIVEERIGGVHANFEAQTVEIGLKMEKLFSYEKLMDTFVKWMKGVNEKLDNYKLKVNIQKKLEHVKNLKLLQSEVASKELELSDIQQSTEELDLQNETEEVFRTKANYVELCETVRTLTHKLQKEIDSHDNIINKVKETKCFINEQKNKLESTLKVVASNHSDMQSKREAIDTLMRSKEEGNGIISSILYLIFFSAIQSALSFIQSI
jgi:Fe2+ transport system protein B